MTTRKINLQSITAARKSVNPLATASPKSISASASKLIQSPADVIESMPSLSALNAEAERRKFNQLGKWFPDEGPYRRALYPKHIEFMNAGAKYNERLFCAANRCISPFTAIEFSQPGTTGYATRRISELFGGKAFDVLSWDGATRYTNQASGIFLKGIEPMFRLYLDNGSTLDLTRKHRVLIDVVKDGRRLSDWVSIDQLVHASDGLHLSHRSRDYPASCATDDRPHDEQLLWDGDSGRAIFPSPDGVHLPKSRSSALRDVEERISQYSRVYPTAVHPSILDDPQQLADLCAQFDDPEALIDDLWNRNGLEALRKSGHESYQRLPELEFRRLFHAIDLPFFGGTRCHVHYSNNSEAISKPRLPARHLSSSYLDHEAELFFRAPAYTSLFVSLNSPVLSGGQRIDYIVPLGLLPVIDFTVERSHNYVIGGVVNHNSGKSVCGALESTFHATGLYPHWWEGRRFDRPTMGWILNKTATDCRDINQQEMLGRYPEFGTGMIPKHLILDTKPKPSVPAAVSIMYIKHAAGGISTVMSKSYDQGREQFQGRAIDWIWADEEIPMEVYTECLLRLLTTKGIIYCTYTPIMGLSPLTVEFLRESVNAAELPFNFARKSTPAANAN